MSTLTAEILEKMLADVSKLATAPLMPSFLGALHRDGSAAFKMGPVTNTMDPPSLSVITRAEFYLPPVKLIESLHMVDTVEDWSGVRSPSRARRRRKQGHRQNIRYITVPKPDLLTTADGTIYGHPETIRVLMEKLGEGMRAKTDDILRGLL